jgi:hypothetical protein
MTPHAVYLINNKTCEIYDIVIESDEQPSYVHDPQIANVFSAENCNDRHGIMVSYFE